MTIVVGEQLNGRFRMTSLLGRGAMGEVWRAYDARLRRDVAVKVMHAELAADAAFRARFDSEAMNAARLNHPNIATVHDYGEARLGGQPVAYLVMELVDGHTLADRLHGQGRTSVAETLDLLGQAAAALAAAHQVHIVHRDVKPANLLLRPDGVMKLTDFGIARARDAAALTGAGVAIGTVQYMAPEQLQGDEVTAAADVYALGVVGYECLTGTRLFDGTREQVAAQQTADLPPLPADVPQAVGSLLARALARSPADRYPDGQAFAAAVRQISVPQAADGPGDVGTAEQSTEPHVAGAAPAAADRVLTKALPADAAPGPRWSRREERQALDGLGFWFSDRDGHPGEAGVFDPSLGPVRRRLARLAGWLLWSFGRGWLGVGLLVLGLAALGWEGHTVRGWPLWPLVVGLCAPPLLVGAAFLTVRTHWIRIVKRRSSADYRDEFRAQLLYWWWNRASQATQLALQRPLGGDRVTAARGCAEATWRLLSQLQAEGRLVEKKQADGPVSSVSELSPLAAVYFERLGEFGQR